MVEKAYNSTRVVVHADHIRNNIEVLAGKTGAGVLKMAVVKADAYGHGAVNVSQITEDLVDWYGVASVEEAMELRDARISKPILVFGVPGVHNASIYERYNLTAVVSDLRQLGILHPGTRYHLEFDTGMGRLGLLPEQVAEVRDAVSKADHLQVEGIMSHFATADEPESGKVLEQLELFRSVRAQFPEHFLTHMANSGGICYYPASHFDMVRHGISMYGYSPGTTAEKELKPALSWEATVVQCRALKKGQSVSYGARWAAPDDGFLITVPVGYADGIPRLLSGRFNVMLNAKPVQQTGTVTMDYIMLYSGVPAGIGNSTVLLLDTESAHAGVWAKTLGTIPYEIVCGISPRIKRIVVNGDS
ncbi:MAG: alanine racemase [Rhodothermaceae bacterium]|nr:alanine racemase [Rhodothermaceae bacterium]